MDPALGGDGRAAALMLPHSKADRQAIVAPRITSWLSDLRSHIVTSQKLVQPLRLGRRTTLSTGSSDGVRALHQRTKAVVYRQPRRRSTMPAGGRASKQALGTTLMTTELGHCARQPAAASI